MQISSSKTSSASLLPVHWASLNAFSKKSMVSNPSPTLSPASSAFSSGELGPPLDEPLDKPFALMIVSTSAITGATQVQPQVYRLVQPQYALLCIFMEITKCIFRWPSNVPSDTILDYTVKWVINYSIKSIFFYIFLRFKCSLEWNRMSVLKCSIECLHKFTFSLNLFVHYRALRSAWPCASLSATQLLPQVHL